ncbi:MAG: response regulator transcription factor [Chloroflexi bacterium]|nr:response regulator transcription factor [Chloroflexota bacterium]
MVSGTPGDKIIGVLVADDHPMLRNGLRAALSAEPDISVLGEAANGLQAQDMAVRLNPDVIIMDIYMPQRDGLESLLSIKKKLPDVKVLMLTVSEREEDLLKAMRFGADGYILKKSDVADVIEAVRKITRGETTLSPYISRKLVKELLGGQGYFGLSAREKEVLELLGEGLTNSEIAGRLFLSYTTVSSYVYRLVQKLHLKNREEAIAYSVRHVKRAEPY